MLKSYPHYLKVFLSLLIFVYPYGAIAAQPELSSDVPIEFEGETNKLIARGNARLEGETFGLYAQKNITLDQDDMQAQAEGCVEFNQNNMRILADRATYAFQEDWFTMDGFRMGFYPYFLQGKSLEGSREEFCFSNTTVFFHEPDCTSLRIDSQRLIYNPCDKTLTAYHIFYKIGPVPFFYMPYFKIHEIENPLEVENEIGKSKRLGIYTRNTVRIPITPELKVGALLDYYERSGFLKGPSIDYLHKSESIFADTTFDAGFVHDSAGPQVRGTDVLGNQIPSNRHFYELRHISGLWDTTDVVGTTSIWSDSAATRDYRPDKYFNENQQPDNFFEGAYRGNNYFLSAFTRFSPNDFFLVTSRLPEARLDVMPTQYFNFWDQPVYTQGFGSVARLQQKQVNGTPELATTRIDTYAGITVPFILNDWSTFTPLTGFRLTSYQNSEGAQSGAKHYTRILGQIGCDAEMVFNGCWDYENKCWNIDGIRHISRPMFQYRYIPKAQMGQQNIPEIDHEVFTTALEPIDLALKRNTDEMNEVNVIRLGWQNLLQTRQGGEYGARDLAKLNIYQDIRFTPLPGQNDYSDTHFEVGIFPACWISFHNYSRIAPETLTKEEFRNAITLTDGDINRITFGNSYVKNKNNQYTFAWVHKLNERNSIHLSLRYDANLGFLVEQVYGFDSYVGNSWKMGFDIILRRNDQLEGPTTFRFRISLLGF